MTAHILHVSPSGKRFRWDGFCDCRRCSQTVAPDGTVGIQHNNAFIHATVARLFVETHYGVPEHFSARELREQYSLEINED